ncbi:MAG TPA: UDP-3-O-(3-hydroxymyristoyl)glucosamine N-acyltransferase [Woeseiaceae bacterium]|nr:UDP-3-O-(3-hydroxymyristoyl)glucosamine N-acyltransferase [Woeseiaceae bacterium]
MRARLGDLATRYGCELVGDPEAVVTQVATLANAGPAALTFFANPAYRSRLQNTAAGAVVLGPADAEMCPVAALISEEPYATYARIAGLLHPSDPMPPGVHASAVVDPSASVAASAHVAAHAVIGPESVVAEHAAIGPNTVVGPRCRVAAHTRLHANVTLVQDVSIGERCIVHPGAVIGADGFGNARGDTGWIKVPQIGGVRIGNDVEIGANTTIDRGAIEDTVIEDGVRLDNLVQIAHNVRLGEHTAMASLSGISGSTVVGKRCMFGGQSGVVGHISICDDVMVGGATMISKDIREPGFYTGSFPAEKDRDWKRKVARFRRLDELVRRIRKLEEDDQSR